MLTKEEFANLIAAVTGKEDEFLGNGRSEHEILQIYTEAIDVRLAPAPLAVRPDLGVRTSCLVAAQCR